MVKIGHHPDSTTRVNKVLTDGWELLAVNPLGEGLVYTLGRRAPKKDPTEGFKLGDHVLKP